MKIQLLRHATLLLSIADLTVLVDPMFGPVGATEPIRDTANQRRNPLVDLPMDEETLGALIESVDAVLVTHTHNDHWDQQARDLLPKSTPIFCQPEDEAKIGGAGFSHVEAVTGPVMWRGLELTRTGGQHGRGRIAELMAPVSGFIARAAGEGVLYIAGDTVWCEDVQDALERYRPEIVVVNAGAAQFNSGGPITMDAADVIQVCQAAPQATVIAVHMEAINHCLESRAALRTAVTLAGTGDRLRIPQDGESVDC